VGTRILSIYAATSYRGRILSFSAYTEFLGGDGSLHKESRITSRAGPGRNHHGVSRLNDPNLNRLYSSATTRASGLKDSSSVGEAYAHAGAYRNIAFETGNIQDHEPVCGGSDCQMGAVDRDGGSAY
jgi:hypothetical protein